MMARMRSFTLSADTSSPSVLFRLEVKKYLSSKIPCGVCTYLFAVARLTVDSCMPMSSATSFSTSGFRCAMPRSRKSRWNLTMLVVTMNSVRWRCWMLLISHAAARILSWM